MRVRSRRRWRAWTGARSWTSATRSSTASPTASSAPPGSGPPGPCPRRPTSSPSKASEGTTLGWITSRGTPISPAPEGMTARSRSMQWSNQPARRPSSGDWRPECTLGLRTASGRSEDATTGRTARLQGRSLERRWRSPGTPGTPTTSSTSPSREQHSRARPPCSPAYSEPQTSFKNLEQGFSLWKPVSFTVYLRSLVCASCSGTKRFEISNVMLPLLHVSCDTSDYYGV